MTRAEQDTRLARAVTMRSRGMSGNEISRALGGNASNILNQTNRVMDADRDHCIENEFQADAAKELSEIETAYWHRVK